MHLRVINDLVAFAVEVSDSISRHFCQAAVADTGDDASFVADVNDFTDDIALVSNTTDASEVPFVIKVSDFTDVALITCT